MAAHLHETNHELIVVAGGEIEVEIAGQHLHGKEGDVLCYPSGRKHAERSVGNAPFESYYVGWKDSKAGQDVRLPLVKHDEKGRILNLMYWMNEVASTRGASARPLLDALLLAVLHEYEHGDAVVKSDLAQQVRKWVQADLELPVTLDDLARKAKMSRFYFSRRFQKETNQSPMDFVRQVRIEAAWVYLLDTQLPLKAIAEKTGFSDEFVLSHSFQKVAGISPNQLRQSASIDAKRVWQLRANAAEQTPMHCKMVSLSKFAKVKFKTEK
jgi:AraC-like DNA-binding protein